MNLDPFRFLTICLAGWLNHQQRDAIDYLREENRVLRQQLGRKRLRFNDEQRSRLASKAKSLSRRVLQEIATLVTPDTLLRWHRKLIAQKYDGSTRRNPGRPRIIEEIRTLAVQMANENRGWGYTRIQGALSNLGHMVGRSTIVKLLKEQGIEPAPERSKKTSWQEFLRAHWQVIAAADFFTVEVWTLKGLRRYLVLFVIELSTRRVRIAGIVCQPNGPWMAQMARNLTDVVDGFLLGKRLLLHDRDPLYTGEFAGILKTVGVNTLKLPARSPNLNAYAERFVRTMKESCLDRMIFFGEASLRHAIREFVAHYHRERNHQGLGNRIISPDFSHGAGESVHCRERLGGMLKYYARAA